MQKCFYCFGDIPQGSNVCPICGNMRKTEPEEPVYLYPGTILRGKYIIGMTVGAGGFGVIYRAWDMHHKVVVAIKEFYSGRLMMRAAGESKVSVNVKTREEFEYRKKRFLAEAQGMAKIASHKNVPNVFDQFEDNNTAYIVMEFLEGTSLSSYIKSQGQVMDVAFAVHVINEVGSALNALHKIGIIHRDVAPDNIFICSGKELRIKLLDFGAAKLAEGVEDVTDKIMKPGYTPVEQYDNSNMGPWTDVYALGATLYFMLTNIKPDESTDRKIKDEVKTPRELNPEVPENLSNAIMKAMAIESHMRFQDVREFLKAVNGEKKVITLEKERKRRRRRRRNSILLMLLLLIIAGSIVFLMYDKSKREGVLEDAAIQIWYMAEKDSAEDEAMNKIVKDFIEKYPNVEIELKAFSENEYSKALDEAVESGNMPDLFESTNVSKDIIDKAISLETVLDSSYADKCNFLTQYSDYYDNYKQIPLGFEIPVAFIITGGMTEMDYMNHYFSNINDICNESEMAYDSRYEEMLRKNFDVETKNEIDGFINTDGNSLAVMLSSSMEIKSLDESEFNDVYDWNWAYFKNEKIYGSFNYEWSVCDNGKAQTEAAKRFLSMMLGSNYQNILMNDDGSDGQLPLNSDALSEKCESTTDNVMAREYWEQLPELLDNIVFKQD